MSKKTSSSGGFDRGQEKKKTPVSMRIMAVIILILAALIITGLVISLARGKEEPVALVYNGVRISKSEYIFFRCSAAMELINSLKFPEGSSDEEMKEMIRDYIYGDDAGKSFWEQVDNKALEEVKKYAIRKAEADEKNITLTQDEQLYIEMEADQLALDYEQKDEYFLKHFGITREQYVNFAMTMNILDKLMNKYINEQNYSQDVLKNYYEENKDSFRSWKIRHILILKPEFVSDDEDNPPSLEEKEEKLRLAMELLEKIKNGEDMEKLVAEYSEDPLKDINKGLYELTADSDYAFKEWAMKASTGDVDLLDLEHGYHIVKCEKATDYEDVKEQVKRYYGIEDYNAYLNQLVKNNPVEPRIYQKVIDSIDMGFFMENFN